MERLCQAMAKNIEQVVGNAIEKALPPNPQQSA